MNIAAIFLAITVQVQTAPRIVDVRPSTTSTFGGAVVVSYEGLTSPTATVDGIAVSTSPGTANTLIVVVPKHAAGTVELKLRGADGAEATATLHYADMTADWEGVLLPILAANIAGAFGSLWNSESLLINQGSDPVDLGPYDFSGHVSPQGIASFKNNARGDPLMLWVPKWALSSVAITSRVQDVSRQAQTWGTELPVVRVSQFSKSVTLLNVPTDVRFRGTLRVYFPDLGTYTFRLAGRPMDRDEVLFDGEYRATSVHIAPSAPMTGIAAWTAISLEMLPNFRNAERLRLTVTSDTPTWAFISVTNNETQHVTLVTPQPR